MKLLVLDVNAGRTSNKSVARLRIESVILTYRLFYIQSVTASWLSRNNKAGGAPMRCAQFTQEERYQIYAFKQTGYSQPEVAAIVVRDTGTPRRRTGLELSHESQVHPLAPIIIQLRIGLLPFSRRNNLRAKTKKGQPPVQQKQAHSALAINSALA